MDAIFEAKNKSKIVCCVCVCMSKWANESIGHCVDLCQGQCWFKSTTFQMLWKSVLKIVSNWMEKLQSVREISVSIRVASCNEQVEWQKFRSSTTTYTYIYTFDQWMHSEEQLESICFEEIIDKIPFQRKYWDTERRSHSEIDKKEQEKNILDTTYQRKNGSQHSKNTPMIMPKVRAALCSARHPFAGRIDPSNLIVDCEIFNRLVSMVENGKEMWFKRERER